MQFDSSSWITPIALSWSSAPSWSALSKTRVCRCFENATSSVPCHTLNRITKWLLQTSFTPPSQYLVIAKILAASTSFVGVGYWHGKCRKRGKITFTALDTVLFTLQICWIVVPVLSEWSNTGKHWRSVITMCMLDIKCMSIINYHTSAQDNHSMTSITVKQSIISCQSWTQMANTNTSATVRKMANA